MTMMMKLYKYTGKEAGTAEQDYIGTVSLEDGETVFDIKDAEYEEKVKQVFTTPVEYFCIGSSGKISGQTTETAEPNTEEFFIQIRYELPRYEIRGFFVE